MFCDIFLNKIGAATSKGKYFSSTLIRSCFSDRKLDCCCFPSSPCKVHFPEVLAVVHVEKVVKVSGPTERVGHTHFFDGDAWQYLHLQF